VGRRPRVIAVGLAEPGRRLMHRRNPLSLTRHLRRSRRRAPRLAVRAVQAFSCLAPRHELFPRLRATLLLLAVLCVPLRPSRRSFRSPVIAALGFRRSLVSRSWQYNGTDQDKCSPRPYEASPSTAAGARFSGSSYVRATRVRRGFLDFRINLASDEDSRAREIQPQQQRNHRLHFRIGPLG
jgi:hypothetical protein